MISILMPCHNCECWVEETLRSVYAQTYTDWELIAADDGSTDGTPDLLRRHAAANAGVTVLTMPAGNMWYFLIPTICSLRMPSK